MSAESALLYLSSEQAESRNDYVFRFRLGTNTIHIDKTVKIVPTIVSLTNIFPNVNEYRNSWQERQDPDSYVEHSITAAQYTITDLMTQLTASSTDCTFTVGSDGYVTITTTGTTYLYSPTIDFFDMLGFQDQVAAPDYTLTVTTSLKATSLPNVGGEKVVFLACAELAPGNCVFGGDGTPYDILLPISFADTAFGYEACYRGADTEIEDVEYKFYNKIATLEFIIRDSKFRPLLLPKNYHFRMILKVFHKDYAKGFDRG